MMTREELEEMTAREEKRLGVNSEEFKARHNDIMKHIESLTGKGELHDSAIHNSSGDGGDS